MKTNAHANLYSDEDLAFIREKWLRDGWTASAISSSFYPRDVSPNAVIGLIHRKGWKRDPSVNRANSTRPNRERAQAQFRAAKGSAAYREGRSGRTFGDERARPLRATEPEPAPVVVLLALKFPAGEGTTPFNQIGAFRCRWVDPEVPPSHDMPCCGAPVVTGYSWCADHYDRVFAKPLPRHFNGKRHR